MNFCVAIWIWKMEENTHFWHIMLYYIKKGKNATETHKKGLRSVWRRCYDQIERVRRALRSFMLEISQWTMLHGRVDQLKLTVIKSRHWEQLMFYHAGDSRHTQNIQINKATGKNEKCVFYGKNHIDFLANPVFPHPTRKPVPVTKVEKDHDTPAKKVTHLCPYC